MTAALALDFPMNLPDLRDVAAFLMAFGRASRARLAVLLAAEDRTDARDEVSAVDTASMTLGLYELIRGKGIAGCVEHPVAPWLADRWVAAQRRSLRLLASLRPGLVSEDIVPPFDRMDLSAATERNLRAQAATERMPPQHLLRVEDLPFLDAID